MIVQKVIRRDFKTKELTLDTMSRPARNVGFLELVEFLKANNANPNNVGFCARGDFLMITKEVDE